MSIIVWKDMRICITWNSWKKRKKWRKNLVRIWRVRVAAILKWLRRHSNFMVMQHQLQSMAGAVTHLDRHCRYRKELTFRFLIRALRTFEGSYLQDHGMD